LGEEKNTRLAERPGHEKFPRRIPQTILSEMVFNVVRALEGKREISEGIQ
jgi:hypothetical protein